MNLHASDIKLFVDLDTVLGLKAVANLNRFLAGYHIALEHADIVDIHSDVQALIDYRITATPCLLLQREGKPLRKLIGDMNNTELLQSFCDRYFNEMKHAE